LTAHFIQIIGFVMTVICFLESISLAVQKFCQELRSWAGDWEKWRTDTCEIESGLSCSIMPLWCFLYFCYWHSWNKIGILHWKWVLMVIILLVLL